MVSDLDMMAGREALSQQYGQTQGGRADIDPIYQPRQYQSQPQPQRSQPASRTVSQNYGQTQNQYGTVNSERMVANTNTDTNINTHHTNNVVRPTSFLPSNIDGNVDTYGGGDGHQAPTAVEMDAGGAYRVGSTANQRQTMELDSTPVTLMPEGSHFYGANVGQVHRRTELDAAAGGDVSRQGGGVGGTGEVRQIYQEVDDYGVRGRVV